MTQILDTITRTACGLAAVTAVAFGVYCAVSAWASSVEDRKVEDLDMRSREQTAIIDARDVLRDLPRAA